MEQISEGVWKEEDSIYTENLAPGQKVYGESLREFEGRELRRWEPGRSKLGAAIANGLPEIPLSSDSTVLYLGAASGTTPSHVSDICREGVVFGVEHSPRVVRDLLKLSRDRESLAPVYADARKPESYSSLVDKADVVFQDVAQPDQIDILRRNCEMFLESGGEALISLKMKAISSSKEIKSIISKAETELQEAFEILWSSSLEPYYGEDHMFYRLKYTEGE